MIKINLVAEAPAAAATKRKKPEGPSAVKKGDLILLVVLAICLGITGGKWYLLTKERDEKKATERELRAERDRLQVFIDKVEELEAKKAKLQHKINVINDLKNDQRGPVRIMDEVSKALPELVWLNNMTLSGDALSLQGVAMDENAVANYISNLDASPYFQEPVLIDMSRAGADTFSFRMSCVFIAAPPEISAESGA
jgi:type IV pilus assembly protein PilN